MSKSENSTLIIDARETPGRPTTTPARKRGKRLMSREIITVEVTPVELHRISEGSNLFWKFAELLVPPPER